MIAKRNSTARFLPEERETPRWARMAIGSLLLVCLCSCFLPSRPLWAQKIRDEVRGPQIVERAILWSESEFRIENARMIGRKFVEENKDNFLSMLTLAASEVDFQASYFGHPHDNTYEKAIEAIGRLKPSVKPMAQVLAMGKDSVLRYRDQNRLVEEVLTGRQDPTLFFVASTKFRLIHFRLAGGGDALVRNRYMLRLFIQVSPVSVRQCAALLERLARCSPVRDVSVSFRTDTWFLDESQFPFLYRFIPDFSIPKDLTLQYLLGPRLRCSTAENGTPQCTGSNFVP